MASLHQFKFINFESEAQNRVQKSYKSLKTGKEINYQQGSRAVSRKLSAKFSDGSYMDVDRVINQMTNFALNDADIDFTGTDSIYMLKNLQILVKEKIECIKNVLENLKENQ
jgi:hypothetical protein